MQQLRRCCPQTRPSTLLRAPQLHPDELVECVQRRHDDASGQAAGGGRTQEGALCAVHDACCTSNVKAALQLRNALQHTPKVHAGVVWLLAACSHQF